MELYRASLHMEDITPVLRLLLECMDRTRFRLHGEFIPHLMVRNHGTNQRFVALGLDLLALRILVAPYQVFQ